MTVNLSGNSLIDTLLYPDPISLTGCTGVSVTTTLTFDPNKSFRTGTSAVQGQTAIIMTPDQQNAVLSAFDEWSKVARISYSFDNNNPTIVFSQLNDIIGNLEGQTFGDAPADKYENIDVFIEEGVNDVQPGQGGYYLILHEIGHALGLDHPNGNPNSSNISKTIMSYVAPDNRPPITPMIQDIAAVQYLYGETNHNSDDTTYDQDDLDGSTRMWTLWDAGGDDTLDVSAVTAAEAGVTLDLRGGFDENGDVRFSEIGDERVAIALDPKKQWKEAILIENAKGNTGDDEIRGNKTENILEGGGGEDILVGDGGADIIYGGADNDIISDLIHPYDGSSTSGLDFTDEFSDVLYGESGDDTIVVYEGNDIVDAGADNDFIVFTDRSGGIALGGAGNDTLAIARGNVTGQITPESVIFEGGAGQNVFSYYLSAQGGSTSVKDIIFSNDGGDIYVDTLEMGLETTIVIDPGSTATIDLRQPSSGTPTTLNLQIGDQLLTGDVYSYNDFLNTGPQEGDHLGTYSGEFDRLADLGGGYILSHDQQYNQFGDEIHYGLGIYHISQFLDDTVRQGGEDQHVKRVLQTENPLVKLSFPEDGFYGLTEDANISSVLGIFGMNWLAGSGANVESNIISTPANWDGTQDLIPNGGSGKNETGTSDSDNLNGTGNDDSICGGEGDDTITTSFGDDTVCGDDGDDVLDTGAGNDVVTGDNDDDLIRAGSGHDSASGGQGNDTIRGSTGNDSIAGGTGEDLLNGGLGADIFQFMTLADSTSLTGGLDLIEDFEIGIDLLDLAGLGFNALTTNGTTSAGELRLSYDSGNDQTLILNDQNDFAIALSGDLTGDLTATDFGFETTGGGGANTITGSSASESIDGTAADDHIFGLEGDDTITGQGGNDTLNGDIGADNLDGGAGNDGLEGKDGNDSLEGGDGEDTLWGDAGNDTARGGNDNDTIYGWAGADSLLGDAGDDLLAGDADNDTLIGGSGNDLQFGYTGDDTLYGGTGNDTLSGEDDNDYLSGQDDDDYLLGGNGTDTLRGGNGNDSAYGEAGNDSIRGEAGDDSLSGADGDDSIFGDDGFDTVLGGAGNDLVAGGDGNDSVFGEGDNDTVFGEAGRDSIYGGDGDDVLDGGLHDDYIDGGAGNDTVEGEGGNDTIYGRDGADNLKGGTLIDIIFGGTGNDTINGSYDEDQLHGEEGDDNVRGGKEADILTGGDGNDTLKGDEGNDSLDGGADTDTLNGNLGDDTILGGAGNDAIYGGVEDASGLSYVDGYGVTHYETDNDTLIGGDGDDWLEGMLGSDELTGGAGNDTFAFDTLAHSTAAESDTITDFTSGDDVIRLTGLGFTTLTSNGTTAAGELRMDYDGTSKTAILSDQEDFVFYINGDVTGTLSNADFIY